jgi:hypothetical protein
MANASTFTGIVVTGAQGTGIFLFRFRFRLARPLFSEPPSEPAPSYDCPATPLPTSIKGTVEQEGCTEADRLLGAIVNVARHEPPNKTALRVLCTRFSREHALDF